MAWPLTPYRSMVDGSTFWDAALGNALQTGTNGIVAGTYSLAATVVDGTGGATVSPVAGTSKVSTNLISTATPSPAFVPGTLYKDLVAVAGGYITNGGAAAIGCGFGISSVSRTGAGIVQINLLNTLASTSKCFLTATIATSGTVFWFAGSTTTTAVVIGTTDTSFTAADKNFAFVLYGSV